MAANKPEDWPQAFTRHVAAGDIEAVVALYAPEATFVTRSGDTLVGREAIRPVLAELIRNRTRLQGRVARVLTVGDVAILYTDFEGTTVDPSSSRTIEMRSNAIEVLRRQADGTWTLIVGDPNARASAERDPDARARAEREPVAHAPPR